MISVAWGSSVWIENAPNNMGRFERVKEEA